MLSHVDDLLQFTPAHCAHHARQYNNSPVNIDSVVCSFNYTVVMLEQLKLDILN